MKLKVRIVDIEDRSSEAFISVNDYEKIFGTRKFYGDDTWTQKCSFVKVNGQTYSVCTGLYHPDNPNQEIGLVEEGCVSFSKKGSVLISPYDGEMVDVVEVPVKELFGGHFWSVQN